VARQAIIDAAGLGDLVAELLPTHTNAQIRSILQRDHGLQISYRAVEDYTRRLRAERAERARAAVHDAISPTVTTDIHALDEAIAVLKRWFDDERLRRSERLVVMRELRQAIDTKLRYSGAGDAQDGVLRITIVDPDTEES